MGVLTTVTRDRVQEHIKTFLAAPAEVVVERKPRVVITIIMECLLGAGAVMKIDIDKLTEDELIDLNNRIVARLRFLNQMRVHLQMLDLRIGDRVTFNPKDGRRCLG